MIIKVSVAGTPSNLGLVLEHITNITEVQIISMHLSFFH